MASTSNAPLRNARLIALSLSWCFAVIAASVGLNSLIKSNQSQSHFKKLVTPPTVVSIDVHDIFDVGVLATTASTLISVLAFNYISLMVLPRFCAVSTKTLRLQAYSLVFCCIILLAAMIPFMVFFSTREADVRAFVGTLELPAVVVQKVAAASGSTPVYKKIDYIRLVAIFPWFALFFTAVAAAVLFKADAVARAQAASAASVAGANNSKSEMSEKETDSRQEV